MSITNKGKKWELLNSLWILWSFTLVLACVGFFWIGGRVGKRKWIIFGLLYLVVNFALVYVLSWIKDINIIYYNIIVIIVCFGWFGAIVHSFMSRKEYLLRREAVIDLEGATRDAYRNEIRRDYLGNNEKSVGQIPLPTMKQNMLEPPAYAQQGISEPLTPVQQNVSEPQTTAQKIDLNTASEQELTVLPGVGIALAKRAIEIRMQIGGFSSVQDFNYRLGLMSHFALQIEALAIVTPIEAQTLPPKNKGRVVDI